LDSYSINDKVKKFIRYRSEGITMKEIVLPIVFAFMVQLIIFCPVSASIATISQGNEVFIGECGLDISSAIGNAQQIAWWSTDSKHTENPPSYIVTIDNPQNFYISPEIFVGKTGKWYQWTDNEIGSLAFYVLDPFLTISIHDKTHGREIKSGEEVLQGNILNFVIDSNMQSFVVRPKYSNEDEFFKIAVKNPQGDEYSYLVDSTGQPKSLTSLIIGKSGWVWSAKDGWDTGIKEKNSGEPYYQEGVYHIWVECNANGMKNNYLAPDGLEYAGKTVSTEKMFEVITPQDKKTPVPSTVSSDLTSHPDPTKKPANEVDFDERIYLSFF